MNSNGKYTAAFKGSSGIRAKGQSRRVKQISIPLSEVQIKEMRDRVAAENEQLKKQCDSAKMNREQVKEERIALFVNATKEMRDWTIPEMKKEFYWLTTDHVNELIVAGCVQVGFAKRARAKVYRTV